jgi:hypothetical protein
MVETRYRLAAVIRGHHYIIDFGQDDYEKVCHELSRWKQEGCPLTWFDLVKLRRKVCQMLKRDRGR